LATLQALEKVLLILSACGVSSGI